MPDISKCNAIIDKESKKLCPLKDSCYRHYAKDGMYQSYNNFGLEFDKEKNICPHFYKRGTYY